MHHSNTNPYIHHRTSENQLSSTQPFYCLQYWSSQFLTSCQSNFSSLTYSMNVRIGLWLWLRLLNILLCCRLNSCVIIIDHIRKLSVSHLNEGSHRSHRPSHLSSSLKQPSSSLVTRLSLVIWSFLTSLDSWNTWAVDSNFLKCSTYFMFPFSQSLHDLRDYVGDLEV